MKTRQIGKVSGVALAMAAAGMMGAAPVTSQAAEVELMHCYDVNVCKGHNDCKTADNACAGHGSCKSQGFVAMTPKACADVGGKQKDDWSGTVDVDLVHCYDVNICKGHNDCKTADNACAGHAECKGQGFVAAPEKSCKDIGGKVGP